MATKSHHKLYSSSESIVRSLDVLCEGTVSKRTLDKLVPLEIYSVADDNVTDISNNQNSESSSNVINARPMRQAAQQAARLRRELIDSDLL